MTRLTISFGHDDIFDPWYPMGNGSLRDVVFLGLHVTQMMGYEDIMNSYRFITHNAAKTLHISDHYGIEAGKPAYIFRLQDGLLAEHWDVVEYDIGNVETKNGRDLFE